MLDWGDLDISEDMEIVEIPVRILERGEKLLRGKRIPLVRVLWRHRGLEEETWEREDSFRSAYPALFEDEQP